MFRFLILALACLHAHHAMAQMPGAFPGGWNGSVALPHAPVAPSGLSMPASPPLAHFAPLPGPGPSVSPSPSWRQDGGPTDRIGTQPATPMTDSHAQQDWNAFQRAERQVLKDMHRGP